MVEGAGEEVIVVFERIVDSFSVLVGFGVAGLTANIFGIGHALDFMCLRSRTGFSRDPDFTLYEHRGRCQDGRALAYHTIPRENTISEIYTSFSPVSIETEI